jgi:hypothetical protein
MKRFFLFALFAVIGSPTIAQIQYGTVGVVYYTKDKIVMAADSRGFIVGNTTPDDSVCKIAAPYGKMVFVSSHAMAYRNLGYFDFVQPWSNIEEIHRAYDTASPLFSTNHDRIVGTAIERAKSISSHFQSMLLWHPEKVIDVARKGNGVLTRAMIGGFDDNGALILLQAIITFQESVLANVSSTVQILDCPRSYCAIGEIEVEQEFVNLTSKRAKKEAKKWKPPKKSKLEDYDILRTMRLVELTIQYHGDDVGGRIDAVQMDKDGSVRWFAIKENCAKD